ncbi:TetR/AcrR family transcriptional regulator [Desulfocicer niacini]
MGIVERRIREKRQRRQQIMAAAELVFQERGFANATLAQIADHAEVSPGTVYLYFKSKEDIFLSIILCMFDELITQLNYTNDFNNFLPLEERIEIICDCLVNAYEKNPKLMKYALNRQGNEKFQMSDEIISSFTKQLHRVINSIAIHFGHHEKMNNGAIAPFAIAKFIWVQFTGTVLVNDSLNAMSQNKLASIFEEFSSWVKKVVLLHLHDDVCLDGFIGHSAF